MAARKKSTPRAKLPRGSSEELKLGLEKLQSSGLTLEDAQQLGIEILSEFQTGQLHNSFAAAPSLKLAYLDLVGEPLSPRPKWPAFYRIRYLKDVEDPNSFAAQTDRKQLRYVNEPEAGVAAYFPHIGDVDWFDLAANPDEPLIITEGELKAAKATKMGFPTIGLGGVFNFKAVRQGIPFLPELEEFDWVKRHVYICYDSDFRTNPNVCLAMNQLSEELVQRGAIVYSLSLPDVLEDGKTGLDDLLVTSADAENLLRGLLRQSEPLGLSRPLWQMNERVVYVRDPGLVLVRKSHQKLSADAFKSHAYSTISYTEQTMRADGEMSYKKVSAAGAWMQWPLRGEVTRLLYEPGQTEMVDDEERGGKAFNVWKGWGCEPIKGDLKLWNQLLDHLFIGAEKEDRVWFERWLAYPLQHPGTKLYSACVFHGTKHGTGKSLIGYMMGQIYGKNFVEINKENLTAGNYDWAEARQFVLGDEVTGSAKRDINDMLKKLITQQTFRINIKYVPTFEIRDVINYYFTSNHPDAFFMEDNERRYFIHEILVGPLADEFYQQFEVWMKRGPGPSALFHYLLNLDLGDFNPHAPARKTVARSRMIADTKSDLGEWVARLLYDPNSILRAGGINLERDLFTNRELLQLYDPEQRTGTTANGLGRELRRSGVPLAYEGKPVIHKDGSDRYYVVRNVDKWSKASRQALVSHVESTMKKRGSSKKF